MQRQEHFRVWALDDGNCHQLMWMLPKRGRVDAAWWRVQYFSLRDWYASEAVSFSFLSHIGAQLPASELLVERRSPRRSFIATARKHSARGRMELDVALPEAGLEEASLPCANKRHSRHTAAHPVEVSACRCFCARRETAVWKSSAGASPRAHG